MQSDLAPSKPRALIIEDEILITEELKGRLSQIGFSVIAAVDSADAGIAIAIREIPDLVLLDIRLKGEKDGIQAAQEIRKLVDVPIVYLTAHSDRLTVDRAKGTEHDGFVLKPFRGSELQTTIAIARQRHAMRSKQNEQ